MRQRARQHDAVLDRHDRALREIGQGGMRGVAKERRALRELQFWIGGRMNSDQR